MLSELGRGAMGVVYLAEDPVIGRKVAIKTIKLAAIADPAHAKEVQARFLREARAAGILRHPAIVTVFDVGETTGVSWLAMEHVPGRNLKELNREGVRFPPARIVEIGRTLAEALGDAHANGIVHRDVKPANVILTDDERVKIMDFGIARIDASDLTHDGQSLGTPNYMSPEQAEGDPIDHRSDLFSLGILLWELLGGRRPFIGPTISSICYQIVHAPPPRLAEMLGAGFAPFDAFFEKALAKNPDDRFATAKEMAMALGELRAVAATLELPAVTRPPVDLGESTQPPTEPVEIQKEVDTVFAAKKPLPEHRFTPLSGGDSSAIEAPSLRNDQPSSSLASPASSSGKPPRSVLPILSAVVVLFVVGLATTLYILGRGEPEKPAPTPPPAPVAAAPEVDLDPLLAQATKAIDAGQMEVARKLLDRAEALLPGDPRIDLLRQRTAEKKTDRKPAPESAAAPTRKAERKPAAPATGPARLSIRFTSAAIGRGFFTAYLDGKQVIRETIDWKATSGIFGSGETGGSLERHFDLESGSHQIRVQFVEPKRKISRLGEQKLDVVAGSAPVLIAELDAAGETLTLRLE